MPRITISYRREDSGVITGRIFDRLAGQYGRDSVFRDIDSIPAGVDFREQIARVLDESDVLLAIVGPKWLGGRSGHSRLDDEADPVRVEIESALRKGLPVIPVLVLRAAMPRAAQLPAPIKDFAYRNAVRVDADQDFDFHISRLVRAISRIGQGKAQARTSDDSEGGAGRGSGQIAGGDRAAPGRRIGSITLGFGNRARRALRTLSLPLLGVALGVAAILGVQQLLYPESSGFTLSQQQDGSAAAAQSDRKIKKLQEALTVALQQADQDRKRLTTETAAAQDKAAAAQKQAQAQAGSLGEAQTRAEKAEKELVAQRAASVEAVAESERLKKQIEALGGQLATERAAKQQANTQADQQADRIKKLDEQLKSEKKASDAALDRQKEQLSSLAQELAVEKQAKVEALNQVDQQKAQLKWIGEQLAASKQSERDALGQADQQKGEIKAMAAQLAAEKQTARDTSAQIERLNSEIRSLRERPEAPTAAASPADPPTSAAVAAAGDPSRWNLEEKRGVQQALRALGHYHGEADGGFGPGTADAIKQFQSFAGHPQTGTLSDAERRELFEKAQRLAVLLDQGAKSPQGIAADSVKGASQRYARAWTAESGKATSNDPTEIAFWYALAAADGEPKAFTNLGLLLARGRGVEKPDPAGAALLWWAAAARGEPIAMFNLGGVFERGIGASADKSLARAWYQRAAEHKHPGAQAALKRLAS